MLIEWDVANTSCISNKTLKAWPYYCKISVGKFNIYVEITKNDGVLCFYGHIP